MTTDMNAPSFVCSALSVSAPAKVSRSGSKALSFARRPMVKDYETVGRAVRTATELR